MAMKFVSFLKSVCTKKVIIPTISWLLYLWLGAWMFSMIEDSEETDFFEKEELWLQNVLYKAINGTSDLFDFDLLCNGSSGMTAVDVMNEMKEDVHNLTEEIVMHFRPQKTNYKWDMAGGIHFSLTVVSTIGYGFIVPRTQAGRIVCVVYASIGIPLNIMFMAGIGRVLSRLIDRSYRRWLMLFGCLNVIKDPPMVMRTRNERAKGDMKPSHSVRKCSISNRVGAELEDGVSEIKTECDKAEAFRTVFSVAYSDWTTTSTRGPEQSSAAIAGSTAGSSDGSPVTADSIENNATPVETGDEYCEKPLAPVWYVTAFVTTYMSSLILAMHFLRIANDDWTLIDLVYYQFITFSTIGFGDLYLKPPPGTSHVVMVLIDVIVVVIGMASLSCVINIAADSARLDKTVTWTVEVLQKMWEFVVHICVPNRSRRQNRR